MRTAILATFIIIAGLDSLVAAQCLPMDDSIVTLTGRVITRTYPGPPNYEDIKRGDRPETQLILLLPKPICAVGPGIGGTREAPLRVDDVKEITLVPSDAVPRIRPTGKVYTVSGSIFEAFTGHHRTKLLMTLSSARLSSNPRLKTDVETFAFQARLFATA